ncbi:hypothetical protein BT93_H1625 [Corymbia citriodora subsp. variegata]|nr:hypothetical protein BT93_H1625 [Corymbia citriodora subsp. variegata]
MIEKSNKKRVREIHNIGLAPGPILTFFERNKLGSQRLSPWPIRHLSPSSALGDPRSGSNRSDSLVFERRLPAANLYLARSSPAVLILFSPQRWCKSSTTSPPLRNSPTALADQLEGNEDEHGKYRSMVIQYILKNREMFEPFTKDDLSFEEYCKTMDNDGTWAGHMELQVASLVTQSNFCIHWNMSPRWYIRNFDKLGARMIHLSYHDKEHYNSVRLKES